ncbi:MAG: hypothetical protein WCL16_13905, partial [bacterium]
MHNFANIIDICSLENIVSTWTAVPAGEENAINRFSQSKKIDSEEDAFSNRQFYHIFIPAMALLTG